jgi:hypothetical protein
MTSRPGCGRSCRSSCRASAGSPGAWRAASGARTARKDARGLRLWLRSRARGQHALLLAIDQFEELFTFADPAERKRLDCMLAALTSISIPLRMATCLASSMPKGNLTSDVIH